MSNEEQHEKRSDRLAGLDPTRLLRMGMVKAGDGTGSENGFTPLLPEELAGRFPDLEVIEPLGSGGMGCVYRARQLRLGREVAVKVLPSELGRDPAFAERFAREARALARLSHANIVTIHDFGQADDQCYIVMEYLDGMNLREWLQTGGPSVLEALNIARDLCDALAYAHREGVVHRDLKPENILFDGRGHVKLADFGLAKLAPGPPGEVSLTATGQALGSLQYMSPEQWERPDHVDHRTDIYALGAVLYEMLTGERPMGRFEPASRKQGVPAAVDEVVHRALQPDLLHRYTNAEQMRRALDGVTPGEVVAAGAVVPSKLDFVGKHLMSFMRRIPLLSLLGAVLILLVGTAPWVEIVYRDRPDRLVTLTTSSDGYSSYLEVAGVRIENFWPLVAGGVIGLLCLVRSAAPLPVDLMVALLAAGGVIHGLLCFVFGAEATAFYMGELLQSRTTIAPLAMASIYVALLAGSLRKLWQALYLRLGGPERGVQSVLRTIFRRVDEVPF